LYFINNVTKILINLLVIALLSLLCLIISEHLILTLIYLDLLLICLATFSVLLSFFYISSIHYIFALFLLAIAAVETAIGLGLIILYYQTTDKHSLEDLNSLFF
jgi:NADH:ubiquinone oxidoreductase subunit K